MKDTQQYLRGQIYWRSPDRYEDAPKGILGKSRPVILISNNTGLNCSPVATVAPITSSERRFPLCTQVPININGRDSWILCEQIYTCNVEELQGYIATISPHRMGDVDEAIKYALGLQPLPQSVSDEKGFEETSDNDSYEDPNSTEDLRRKQYRWTEQEKLQLVIDVECHNDGKLSASDLLKKYNFAGLQSLKSTYRRFKKQLGV